jgi:hypothetical protein
MEPENEYSEREENGVRETRSKCYDPETETHVEEIKIEKTEDEPEEKD